jgi:lipid-binding SYLF domain-containing protein
VTLGGLAIALLCPAASAQVPALPSVSAEERMVLEATTVFEEMLNTPGAAIPRAALAGAHGVAIIPRVIRGGFIVGARHGRGVFVGRDEAGVWHAPLFLTLTGGNIGWQAGVNSTDVVLVYRTQRSVQSLLDGRLTLGADIAAAAGPVGRTASAATDSAFQAEMFTYARSRGLFAGVALDGSVLRIDQAATAAFYRPAAAEPGVAPGSVTPPSAQRLVSLVVAQTTPETPVAAETAPTPAPLTVPFGPEHTLDEAASVRGQLAEVSPRLFRLLDPAWQQHLALPAEVFQEAGHPTPEQLAATAALFDAVAADPRYVALTARPEFQATHALVRNYAQMQATTPAQPMVLPPPPPR